MVKENIKFENVNYAIHANISDKTGPLERISILKFEIINGTKTNFENVDAIDKLMFKALK